MAAIVLGCWKEILRGVVDYTNIVEVCDLKLGLSAKFESF